MIGISQDVAMTRSRKWKIFLDRPFLNRYISWNRERELIKKIISAIRGTQAK